MQNPIPYRWPYHTAPRHDGTLPDVKLAQLGHMMDTLKDTILILRHIARDVALDPVADPHTERYHLQQGVRPYVERIASDMRNASTFTLTDQGRPTLTPAHPDLSAFMNHLHAIMRGSSLVFGKAFLIPDALKPDVEAYDAAIKRYQELLTTHRNPTTGQVDIHSVPQAALDDFAADFVPLANRLCDALEALPDITFELNGQRVTIPNQPSLNPQLPAACAARMAFALRTLGRGAADANKRPAQWEYYGRMGQTIYKQSAITDTMQGLLDRISDHGVDANAIAIDKSKVQALSEQYRHSFQLALTACRTIGCGYDTLYADLEQFIRIGGGDPAICPIESPADAALLLFAAERRIARESVGDADPAIRQLRHTLRRHADGIGQCKTLDELKSYARQHHSLAPSLTRAAHLIADNGWDSALPAIGLLQQAFGIAPSPLRER